MSTVIDGANINRKRKNFDEMDSTVSKKARFTQTYHRQLFTLPDSIIYYICKHPSTIDLYAKMVQTCKYFFIKNHVLFISNLYYADSSSSNGFSCEFNRKSKYINMEEIACKIWIGNEIIINSKNQSIASSISRKLYSCDAKVLIIKNQIFSCYDELKMISANAEEIDLHDVIVKAKDGSNLPLEKIFEALTKAKIFEFYENQESAATNGNTIKKLLELPRFIKLEFFKLKNISHVFDIETFYIYAKANENTDICISFCNEISDEYKKRIKEIVYEMADEQNGKYKMPKLSYPGFGVII